MRLRRLELTAYGQFSGAAIELRADASVHLIVGPNEAGKTTRRAAITDLLYGFKNLSEYAFLHGYASLRVGGTIESHGELYEVVRRKGRGLTLLDREGNALDPAIPASWVSGIEREAYVRLGSISHDELKDGARMLLEDEGAAATLLFSAAAGGFPARAFLKTLEEEAASIFRPRAQNLLLNGLLSDFAAVSERRREATTDFVAWEKLLAEIEATSREVDELECARAADEREITRLQRLLDLAPRIDDLEGYALELLDLRKRAVLPDPEGAKLRELLHELTERNDEFERTRRHLAILQREQAESVVDRALLDAYAEIEELLPRVGEVRKGKADLTGNHLIEKRDAARDEIEFVLRRIWPQMSFEAGVDLAYHRRAEIANALAIARAVLRRYAHLAQTMTDAEASLRRLKGEIKRASADLERFAAAREIGPLEAALAEIDRAGPIDQEIEELEGSISAERERLAVDLRALGIELDEPLDARLIALPLHGTIEHFRILFGDLERREKAASETRSRARTAVTMRRTTLERVGGADLVASEGELHSFRVERNALFDTILAESPLPSASSVAAYRQFVARADAFADLRFERAAEIGKVAVEMHELQREERELVEAEERSALLVEERVMLAQEWATSRTPALASVATPAEALERLTRIEATLASAQRIIDGRERHALLVRRRERLHAGLRTVLAEIAPPALSLGALARLAREERKKVLKSEAERSAAARRLEESTLELPEYERVVKERSDALAAWAEEWQGAVGTLELSGVTFTVSDAAEILDLFDGLLTSVRAFTGEKARIAGIERDYDEFLADAEALLARCAISHLLEFRRDPFAAIDRLRIEARKARDAAVQNEQRAKEIERNEAVLARIRERIDELVCGRDDLLAPLGVTPSEAESVLLRQARHRELVQVIERLRSEIRVAMRAEPDGVIQELADRGGAGELRRAIARSSEERDRDRARLHELIERRGAAVQRQSLIRSSHGACDAQVETMAIGAEIDRHARRYAALNVARVLLAERIEAYAAAHQAPVIAAASRILAVMTLGRYVSVRIDENEGGEPVLQLLMRDGTEKSIQALSEGTKDQLYLSLRLATLEERLRGTSGPPLMLDDAVKNFDDVRTVAAFRALGEFSRSAQVLYFTPRTAVIELAHRALGADLDVVLIE
jgi:uncharacterized protein YhaN